MAGKGLSLTVWAVPLCVVGGQADSIYDNDRVDFDWLYGRLSYVCNHIRQAVFIDLIYTRPNPLCRFS